MPPTLPHSLVIAVGSRTHADQNLKMRRELLESQAREAFHNAFVLMSAPQVEKHGLVELTKAGSRVGAYRYPRAGTRSIRLPMISRFERGFKTWA